jgi:prevent-host-death family protein
MTSGRTIRIQCKTASRHGDVVVIHARASRRTSSGQIRGVYTPDEVDVIAAYCDELRRCFAIPLSRFAACGSMYLRLAPARNGQRAGLNFADEYPFGAIAQLEERSAGSRQVGGSSPPSSIPDPADPSATVIGAHEFRNRFGWYMERAAAGELIVVTRRGKPHLRLSPARSQLALVA